MDENVKIKTQDTFLRNNTKSFGHNYNFAYYPKWYFLGVTQNFFNVTTHSVTSYFKCLHKKEEQWKLDPPVSIQGKMKACQNGITRFSNLRSKA